MDVERIPGPTCGPPFPVYEHLLDSLAPPLAGGAVERDATVAHVLATCAGYAYADTETFATVASRSTVPPSCAAASESRRCS